MHSEIGNMGRKLHMKISIILLKRLQSSSKSLMDISDFEHDIIFNVSFLKKMRIY